MPEAISGASQQIDAAHYDHETDLLVFGSGAGGLSAGLFGHKEGLRVLLCEKSGQVGGTTATSGGGVTLGPAIVFAYRAVKHAAAQSPGA